MLLGFLAERPKHGYELKKEHDHRLAGARPLAYGQVYATLQRLERLERDGLAEVAETQQEGGPERTLYAITDSGQAELEQWLNTVEPSAPYVASPLFARVAVAGKAADSYLLRQREAHLARMRELTAEKASGAPAQVLAADYALQHLDADLR
ncbi:PadR family transcriptional regulator [Nonomuraea sp. MTCD27]|uniref:PadR family transcriptional regulator n=1 Tax=Nonomuraea sp. MTCD27 TaxID=1676747 RepID=UPI0035C10007